MRVILLALGMLPMVWAYWDPPIVHRPTPTPTPVPTHPAYQIGRATLYSPGLMESIARGRGIKLDGATGFSTYPDCRKIGGVLVVQVLDPRTNRWSGWDRKRIVDCSQTVDYARHVAEGLVELPYKDAVTYGYSREGHTDIRFYLSRR